MDQRCAARRDFTATAELCPERDDCERHRQFTLHGPGDQPAPLWLCASLDFEARIPRPCAGKLSRVSNRTHWICRGTTDIKPCARLQYAAQDGIEPDFSDSGCVTCVDKVVSGERLVLHRTKIVDADQYRDTKG